MSIQTAFQQLCPGAEQAQTRYVSLYMNVPFYGGPEEGGWWGTDTVLEAYQAVRTPGQAEALKAEITDLAKQMTADARRAWGQRCSDELDAAAARGLDADDLPETNGAESYFVVVEEVPGSQESRGSREWE